MKQSKQFYKDRINFFSPSQLYSMIHNKQFTFEHKIAKMTPEDYHFQKTGKQLFTDELKAFMNLSRELEPLYIKTLAKTLYKDKKVVIDKKPWYVEIRGNWYVCEYDAIAWGNKKTMDDIIILEIKNSSKDYKESLKEVQLNNYYPQCVMQYIIKYNDLLQDYGFDTAERLKVHLITFYNGGKHKTVSVIRPTLDEMKEWTNYLYWWNQAIKNNDISLIKDVPEYGYKKTNIPLKQKRIDDIQFNDLLVDYLHIKQNLLKLEKQKKELKNMIIHNWELNPNMRFLSNDYTLVYKRVERRTNASANDLISYIRTNYDKEFNPLVISKKPSLIEIFNIKENK